MPTQTPITPDRVGRMAIKVATEAAYVLAGFADVVAGTVQDVVKAGKQQVDERRAASPGAAGDAVRGVPDQLRGFLGEVADAYRGLSARGRVVFSDGFATTAHRPAPAQAAPDVDDSEQPPAEAAPEADDSEQPPTQPAPEGHDFEQPPAEAAPDADDFEQPPAS